MKGERTEREGNRGAIPTTFPEPFAFSGLTHAIRHGAAFTGTAARSGE